MNFVINFIYNTNCKERGIIKMSDYLNEFLPDLDAFKEMTMRFYNGDLKVPEYKSFSGGYGSYAQRGAKKHMLRLRMAGGALDQEHLAFVVELCRKYSIDKIKMTTCQCFQLHNIEAPDLCDMIESVWRAGLMTRGGGGDFPRNVMCSPLSGVQADENFDVLPYAKAAGEYMMRFIKGPKFPRKLKVAFSNSPENEPHATFRDLGFVARPDGKFDVYCAGGLGNNPKLGVQVDEAVEPELVLYYVRAMVDTFIENGNYENRGRARTRYMQETLGVDGLKAVFHKHLEAARAEGGLELDVEPAAIAKAADGTIEGDRVTAQKQEGLYAVYYQPVGGDLAPDKLAEIYDVIKGMDEVELRITPEEGMYIINCTAEEAKKVLAVTEDSAKTEFDRSVACVGAAICQVGVGDSQGMLQKCVAAVREAGIADGALPQIHISGCPSSCGTHQIAKIGFRGAMKQTPEGPKPAFAISVGGCPLQGSEVLAPMNPKATMTVDDIPVFLVELGKRVEESGMNYDEWIAQNADTMNELIAKYTA